MWSNLIHNPNNETLPPLFLKESHITWLQVSDINSQVDAPATVRATAYKYRFNQPTFFVHSFAFVGAFSWGPLPRWVALLPWSMTVSSPCSIAFLLRSGQSCLLSSAQATLELLETMTLSLRWHCRSYILIHCCCCLRCHPKIAGVIDIPARFFSCGVNGIRMSVSYETGKGDMHFSWACVCAVPKTSTVLGCLWQERAAFDGLVFACEMAMAGSGVFTWTCYGSGKGERSETEGARHSNWHSPHLCGRNKEVKCRWDSDQL